MSSDAGRPRNAAICPYCGQYVPTKQALYGVEVLMEHRVNTPGVKPMCKGGGRSPR